MTNAQVCAHETQQQECGNAGGPCYLPAVDVIETQDELLLTADVPGADAAQLDIQFEDGELRVHAPVKPRRPADQPFLLAEYGTGDYFRTFRLGREIDASKIEARLSDGVLTLRLPKSEAMKPRKIAVNAG